MALDYELRSDFANVPLVGLLDHSVASFQGVGDTARSLLENYFGITTIGQLANMSQFRQALAIQKLALESAKVANTPVSSLMATRALDFTVREDDRHLTVKQLLDAPIHALSEISPAQDLALYDAFRVTNLRQLAHNRIMIEARIIQYLGKHGPEAANVSGSTDEILALLAGELPGGNGRGAAGVRAEKPATPDQAEGELAEHVRGRLDALRDRARLRAQDLSTRDEQEAGDERLAAIRATRERSAGQRAGRSESVGNRPGGRGEAVSQARSGASAAITAARQTRGSGRAGEIAATAAERESARRGVTATTRGAAAGAPPRPSVRESQAKARQEQERAAAQQAAAQAQAERKPPPGPALQPWMIAVAVAVVVVVAALVWFTRSGSRPPEPPQTAQAPATVTPGQPSQASTAPVALTTTKQAGAPMAAGTAATATPGPTVSAAGSTTSAPGPTVSAAAANQLRYTVRRGNSLWRISRMHYDDPLQWPEIYDANRSEIDNPNLIYPGQRFVIPSER